MCQLCRMKSTLINLCVDSLEWNGHWYAYVSTLSKKIDPDLLMCRQCGCDRPDWPICRLCRHWLNPDWLIYRPYWLKLTLLCSSVDSVQWNWPRLALVSTLSTVTDPDMPMCRLCRVNSTLICSFIDSVDLNWHWDAHLSTLSKEIDPDMLMWRLCRIKLTMNCRCVDSVAWNRPW